MLYQTVKVSKLASDWNTLSKNKVYIPGGFIVSAAHSTNETVIMMISDGEAQRLHRFGKNHTLKICIREL